MRILRAIALVCLIAWSASAQSLRINPITGLPDLVGSSSGGGAATSVTTSTLAGLPATCAVGDARFVTNSTISAGGFFIYYCTATNTWAQFGYIAGGLGALSSTCTTAGCTIEVTAEVLRKSITNVITGGLDVSGGSFSAPFKIASSAPGTCDATKAEFYVNTTSHLLFQCTATNTWTQVGGGATTTAWDRFMVAQFIWSGGNVAQSIASDGTAQTWGLTSYLTTGFVGTRLNAVNDHATFVSSLPAGWTGALTLEIASTLNLNNTGLGTYTLTAKSGCIANNALVDGHTWNTGQDFSQTLTTLTQTKSLNINSITLTSTGCNPGDMILIDINYKSNAGTADPPMIGFLRLSGTRTL